MDACDAFDFANRPQRFDQNRFGFTPLIFCTRDALQYGLGNVHAGHVLCHAAQRFGTA